MEKELTLFEIVEILGANVVSGHEFLKWNMSLLQTS